MKRIFFVICMLTAAGLFFNFYPADASSKVHIRAAVAKNAPQIDVYVRGRYSFIDPKSGSTVVEGITMRDERVLERNGKIVVGHHNTGLNHVRLEARKDIAITVGEKRRKYRGDLDFIINKEGSLLVVNSLELERYIKGVLYHEITDRWPMEAMKAQAIAVRSYALYQMEEKKAQLFDVTSDIYSQVYGGKDAERYRTSIAANRTKGKVLKYNGKILPAYFHSNSGGHTEDASELWKVNLPPLRGKPDEFAQFGPNFRWKKNFRSKDVQELLNENGYNLGLIKEIRVLEKNFSGRNKVLELTTREGKKVTIPGKKFRDILGPNNLKSNKYDIEMKGYYFDIHGQGWGHGVGLCQWGAYAMAKQRHSAKAILEYYYPGADISTY